MSASSTPCLRRCSSLASARSALVAAQHQARKLFIELRARAGARAASSTSSGASCSSSRAPGPTHARVEKIARGQPAHARCRPAASRAWSIDAPRADAEMKFARQPAACRSSIPRLARARSCCVLLLAGFAGAGGARRLSAGAQQRLPAAEGRAALLRA
ncbi:MAG: hypothetical protein MZW92_01375 [Comamonadaceae bacterium]|nr:hypothetical protein [Comamonadaceae bacterium]